MGWLRKGLMQTWAALVALFLRCFWCVFTKREFPAELQKTPTAPVGSVAVQDTPVEAPVEMPANLLISTPVENAPAGAAVRGLPSAADFSATTQPLDHQAPAIEYGADLLPIAGSPLKALIDQLEKAFPAPSIKPGSDMASLQYAAGQRAVVEWVRMKQKRGQA